VKLGRAILRVGYKIIVVSLLISVAVELEFIRTKPIRPGWYLITPPGYFQTIDNDESYDPLTLNNPKIAHRVPAAEGDRPNAPDVLLNAPLSEWELVNSYDTAAQCEEKNKADNKRASTIHLRALLGIGSGQCIASNDPRLAQH
jgi:hypothetical protein